MGFWMEFVYNFDFDFVLEEGYVVIRYIDIKLNWGNEGLYNYDFFVKIKKKNNNFYKNSYFGIML